MDEKKPITSRCGNRCDLCPAYYKNINKSPLSYISHARTNYRDM